MAVLGLKPAAMANALTTALQILSFNALMVRLTMAALIVNTATPANACATALQSLATYHLAKHRFHLLLENVPQPSRRRARLSKMCALRYKPSRKLVPLAQWKTLAW